MIVWRGSHIYIEYFLYHTPSKLSLRACDCLRGAYLREEVFLDSVVAEEYLEQALKIMIEDDKLMVSDPIVLDTMERLAKNSIWQGNLYEATLKYNKIRDILIDSLSSSSSNEDEEKEKLVKVIEVNRKLADLYIKMKAYNQAEKYLGWIIEILKGKDQEEQVLLVNQKRSLDRNKKPVVSMVTELLINNPKNVDKQFILCVNALAGLYAQKKNFEYALPIYLGMLKLIQAIVMGHLGEVFYGMDQKDDAMGWMQKGLTISKSQVDERDCDECSGVILNNLGLIHERDGNKQHAISLFSQATEYAYSSTKNMAG
nr:12176_t:CDS:2 [Entrophospora candida]